MGWILLLIVIAWPVVEIAVFIQVGEAIGWLNTIFLFVAAGAIGLWLLRTEGLALLMRAQREMNEGRVPVSEGFDALCLGVGALLLILPGFITDIFALLLLVPPVRSGLRALLVRWVAAHERRARTGPGLVIEGDYEDVTRRKTASPEDDPDKIVHRRD